MSILIAYDGMEHTKKALEYAIQHSKVYNQPLYIFSVITSKDKLDMENEIEKINAYLIEAREKAVSEGADAQIILESGTPGKSILEAAARFNTDTIIVGRSDKSLFDRAVLGSVSDYVVRNAKVVVIVVQ
ncbi:MAG: universal stress protein [Candidatus Methanomethylophilaceae archaeon]|nr:universal stress protein [Candidatus Methanomethylophilaceae archaeon]MDY0224570.1 universal stress protein [Candidatus Methanomethylophilaceae archaeon]